MKNVIMFFLANGFLLASLSANAAGISRSAFTTEIVDKEPATELTEISVDITRVYFFTEITGLSGHTITHRWEYNGQVMAEVTFQVNANRWRTWSSKNLLSSWAGKWQVSVLDEGGNVIEQGEFDYVVPAIELQPETQPATRLKTQAEPVEDKSAESHSEQTIPEQTAPATAQ